MNNNNTNIDKILNECQQNINKALNLVRGNKTEVRTLPVYDLGKINKAIKDYNLDTNGKTFTEIAEEVMEQSLKDSKLIDNSDSELDYILAELYRCKAVTDNLKDIKLVIGDDNTTDQVLDCCDEIIDIVAHEVYEEGYYRALNLVLDIIGRLSR